jgi:hypothetical protein
MTVLATIEDPAVIRRILTHLGLPIEAGRRYPRRGRPRRGTPPASARDLPAPPALPLAQEPSSPHAHARPPGFVGRRFCLSRHILASRPGVIRPARRAGASGPTADNDPL